LIWTQNCKVYAANEPSDLRQHIKNLLEIAVRSNTVQTRAVSSAIFEALEKVFKKIDVEVPVSKATKDDGKIAQQLKNLLFQQIYASYPEAISLKRANAVYAIAATKWDAVKKGALDEMLDAETKGERVLSVREKLEMARSKMG
jgi:hypothetical protein